MPAIARISNENKNLTIDSLVKNLSPKIEKQAQPEEKVDTLGSLNNGDEQFNYDVNELKEINTKDETQAVAKTDEKLVKLEFTTPKESVAFEQKLIEKKPQDWAKINKSQKLNSEFEEKDIFSSHRIMNAGTAKISDFGGPGNKSNIHNSIFNPDVIANLKELDEGKKIAEIRKNKDKQIVEGKKEWEKDVSKNAVAKKSLITPSGNSIKSENNWNSACIAKNQLSIFDSEKLKKFEKGMDEVIAEQNITNKKNITREISKNKIKTEKPVTSSALQSKLLDSLMGKK